MVWDRGARQAGGDLEACLELALKCIGQVYIRCTLLSNQQPCQGIPAAHTVTKHVCGLWDAL